MTIDQIIKKLKIRWFWLVLTILPSLLFSFLISGETYQINLTFGLNFNQNEFLQNNDSGKTYLDSLPILSNFLVNNFGSVYTQNQIAIELGEESLVNIKKPFFEIQNLSNGFVNLSWKTDSSKKAQKFSEITQKIYKNQIIKDWNKERLSNFGVKVIDNFNPVIIRNSTTIQTKILPILAGIILGFILIILIPLNENNPENNLNSIAVENSNKN